MQLSKAHALFKTSGGLVATATNTEYDKGLEDVCAGDALVGVIAPVIPSYAITAITDFQNR